jgi:hypothetical protein
VHLKLVAALSSGLRREQQLESWDRWDFRRSGPTSFERGQASTHCDKIAERVRRKLVYRLRGNQWRWTYARSFEGFHHVLMVAADHWSGFTRRG